MQKKVWLIIQREYLVQIRQKSFVIMTLLAPIFLIGLGGASSLLYQVASTNYRIAVIDENPKQRVASGLRSEQNFIFFFHDLSEKAIIENRLKDKGDIDALLVIPDAADLSHLEQNIHLYTRGQPGRELHRNLVSLLNKSLGNLKLQKKGIDPDLLKSTASDVHLKITNLKSTTMIPNIEIKISLSIVMMYAVMMFILIYGVRVMRSVIEEKNSRIVEIIISSVKPFQLMIGKILGTALVALTQFTIWTSCVFLAAWMLRDVSVYESAVAETVMPQLKDLAQSLFRTNCWFLISMFLIYFIGGYLFFSAFFATIGSTMENEGESQQYSILASIILMLSFYAGILASNHPTGWMSFWLSIFPLTSPLVMLARLPYEVPAWELLLSLSILFLSVWGMICLAAKIYRASILNFNGQGSIKSFFRMKHQNRKKNPQFY